MKPKDRLMSLKLQLVELKIETEKMRQAGLKQFLGDLKE